MRKRALIKRHLPGFGLDLVWDGKVVALLHGDNILESHEAKTGVVAGRVMEQVEDECFAAATAMC
jgi:hypothetical protein